MPVPQITIRLSPASKVGFEEYAARLGLRASELAKLLIVRERHERRLVALRDAAERPKRRDQQTQGERLPTVTAHMSSLAEVTRFDEYAHQFGLNRNGAGALLLEAELRERWLEKALGAS